MGEEEETIMINIEKMDPKGRKKQKKEWDKGEDKG